MAKYPEGETWADYHCRDCGQRTDLTSGYYCTCDEKNDDSDDTENDQ